MTSRHIVSPPEPIVPISAIEHHAYCRRQCALIHGDGVWADNEHVVRGQRDHRRPDSGEHRTERGWRVLRAIPLWSEALGLSGRADVVQVRGDEVRPIEYKAGSRHGDAADLQVCAQALCLEEMLEVSVPSGFVWYGATRRRATVDFTADLREATREAITLIRAQMQSGVLPLAPNDKRCHECQLRPHCLPEISSAPDLARRYVHDLMRAPT
jgi:CRISPR-associated exonuclease Cas4